jgi:hypothetical protein
VTLFLRGFLIVACTAANVRLISRGMYGWAFVTGWAISFIWWSNSHTAARSKHRWDGPVYAFGAGAGTVFGMWVGGLL